MGKKKNPEGRATSACSVFSQSWQKMSQLGLPRQPFYLMTLLKCRIADPSIILTINRCEVNLAHSFLVLFPSFISQMVLVVQLGFFVWINPGPFAAFYKQIIVTLGNLVYMP